MARIPDSELERLKTDVSLLRLIEDSGLALKKQGKDYAVHCPFHDDSTASLIVTPAKNLYHCFGCGAAGGPIDWVMKMQGISFRHAVEVLREGLPLAADMATPATPCKQSTVPKLATPVSIKADDQAALAQVIDYYHDTLKHSPEALEYLKARGLDHPELVATFRLGFANRTLGLRLPEKNRLAGAEIRGRLQALGILRESGHEHFNGSLVVPVIDSAGAVQEIYGRKLRDDLRTGTARHLYLPGPHVGVWNEAALAGSPEVILCEALIDAMTFWCAGYRTVTASYGVHGFTDEHLAVLHRHRIERVLIAYDRDDAGDAAAVALAARLRLAGFDVYRLQFPKGMDANEYALKVTPAAKSLGLLIRKAEWMGEGLAPVREAAPPAAAPAPRLAPSLPTPAAKEKPTHPLVAEAVVPAAIPPALPAAAVPPMPPDLDAEISEQEVVLYFGEGPTRRRWRVRGLPRNLAIGVLKVNLMVGSGGAFHVDSLDLYAARARGVFVQQAAAELHVPEALLKTELGRVLLKLEQVQDDSLQKALEPKIPPTPAMSDSEREQALALLRTPALFERVLADFDACGIVGEGTNKLTAYLAATSRLLDRPLAIVVQSSSAAGKSSLMDAVLAFMPPEETVRYSAMSGQSLFYMGETNLKHKVLAIAEEEGASRASYALKLLQSDGELTMASTGSDANGNLVTQEYRVEGPLSLFMTTTAIDVDEELLNRCLVLSVDEGREQTAAIHRRQRERRTLAGLMGKEHRDAVLTLHRNAQRLLRPLTVVNPFADQLTFLDDRMRTRRDHEKYLSLIDTIALLHQHQRPVKTLALTGRTVDYIEVTRADIARANALAHEVLGRSLDELPPQTRKLLGAIQTLVQNKATGSGSERRDIRFGRAEVRQHTGLSDTQCRLHLERLSALEYLLEHRGQRGQRFEYELLFDGQTQDSSPHLPGLLDVTTLKDGRATPTTASSRGGEGEFAGSARPQNGPKTGPSRMSPAPENPILAGDSTDSNAEAPESRPLPVNGKGRSYPHTVHAGA